MIDYAVLRIIWWLLMGILLAGFAIFDGFDLGSAALLPFIGRTDTQRRIIINTVGPVWEGNQVWFILGGGVFFAAWPYLYATSFSGFYIAMFLVLLTFIMRPVGFKYRSKLTDPRWRSIWDWVLCIAAILAAVTFGVAVGNVLQGVPFHFTRDLHVIYTGSFWALFNPFAVLCGIVSLFMLVNHGAVYLTIKTEQPINVRAIFTARIMSCLLVLCYAIAGYWLITGINGYALTSLIDHAAPSNPTHKAVIALHGAWISNYSHLPWLLIAPLLGFVGALGVLIWVGRGKSRIAFLSSSASILGIVGSVGASMFPFILPSSSTPGHSLLVWDASASQASLFLMLIATIIFLPIVLAYTGWVYRVLRGKVTESTLQSNDQAY